MLQSSDYNGGGGQEWVLGFKDGADRWTSKYGFKADVFCLIGNTLCSFLNGNIYSHGDAGNYNTFFGEIFPTVVSVIANTEPTIPKTFNYIHVDANKAPDYTHMRTARPWSGGVAYQSTHMSATRYNTEEGMFRGRLWFDRLSPNAKGTTYDEKMHSGDRMRAKIGLVFMEYNSTEAVSIKSAGVQEELSTGHISG